MSKRIIMMIVSTIILGLGISTVIAANLGATAVTSLAYILSLVSPISFGVMTFIFNILYIIVQKFILKEKFHRIQWLQIIVSIFLSLAIDAWSLALQPLQPSNYIIQLLILVAGCAIIAWSIILQLEYNPVYNPSEGFVLALSELFSFEFGNVKVGFDVSLVAISLVISLISFGYLNGVREGTIICSFLVGWFISLFKKLQSKGKPE